ncbi:MAG: hypothetical protein IIU58_07350 [Clostridia bacterium]|nr:hypothetical protein [Clostridia bacterium]
MEKTLDFKVLFYMLRTKLVWIILAAIIGSLLAFCVSSFLLTEQFAASTQFYISNSQEQNNNKVNSADLVVSRSIASTYCIILESKRATDLLKHKLSEKEQFARSAIKSYNMDVSVMGDSEVLKITVTSPDPNIAALVCNTMVDVSVDMISEIFEGGRSNPLGEAVPNYTPISPNIRSNMAIGALLGICLSCALIILVSFMDNRVKDEADFVSKVGIPVLGEVPSIHGPNTEKDGYGYYAYSKKQKN